MKKQIFSVCIIALCLLSVANITQVGESSNIVTRIIVKETSSYEYGIEIGIKLYHKFHFLSTLFKVFTQNNEKENIYKNAKQQELLIKKNFPSIYEELIGLSESLHIKIGTILALQNYLFKLGGECTVTASTSPATKDNQTFLTQNLDAYTPFSLDLYLYRLFFSRNIRIHNSDSHLKYAFIGVPIILEYPLINEEGLGFGGTGTSITRDKERLVDEGDGISPYYLVKHAMMNFKNVSEVANLFTENTRSSHRLNIGLSDWDYDNFIFCDRGGGILIIEQTHSYLAKVFGNSTAITNSFKGIVWHANHHQWLNPSLTGSLYSYEYITSEMRANRSRDLLESSYGAITIETCKNITRDHGGGFDKNKRDSGDICRHPDKYALWITSFSWIIQPKTMTIYLTSNAPCNTEFNKYNFTEFS